MTSSKYLRSGLKSGFAFPIMLAAVGLLLASLVLGLGNNQAQALGDQEGGICGYSDLMREAILANNKHKSYECNDPLYIGTGSSWGGTTSRVAGADADGAGVEVTEQQDEAKDLDLSGKGLSEFKPGVGELDGFVRGSRVDLTGNGLTVADIDLSDAVKSADGAVAYTQLGAAVGRGNGTLSATGGTRANTPPTGLGITFLLDGGSTSANGLTTDTFEGVEGEIVWITFEYGDMPKVLTNDSINSNDGGVWLRVDFTIDEVDAETVSVLINSNDAPGTLYAVPYRIRDNAENDFGRTDKQSIDISFHGIGTFTNAVAASPTAQADPAFGEDEFDDSVPRAGQSADLIVVDEDDPPVSVADRQDAVADKITARVGLSAKRVGIDQLAGRDIGDTTNGALLTTLVVGAADGTSDKIDSINVGDLSGLTGLKSLAADGTPALNADTPPSLLVALDLSDNDLTELPSGLFADVGKDTNGDLSTLIDVTGNKGPTGDGFMLDNLGPVGDELIAGQVLKVNTPRKDNRVGFTEGSYDAVEGGVWVFDVNIDADDIAATVVGVQLKDLAGDSGKLTSTDDSHDVKSAFIDLSNLAAGNYRIAIGLPTNKKEDTDNTLTALFGHAAAVADPASGTNLTSVLDVASLTIRDASSEAPVDMPTMPESSFDSVVVTQNEFVEAPGNEDLKHNISNFTVTVGGNAVSANFLDVYNATGGLERWGYPTSEVVEIPGIGLTQFFQRGALHLAGNETVTRLLAWDYVGGGLGGSVDQQVEAAPETAPEGGEQVGAFGHYVANVDADGNATGFLDFFNRLGGVDAFGFPKTEARADTGADGTLMEPGTTAGFTRQYFQAAVFQLAEDGSVQLTLLGDTLRGILVPGYADIDAFGAADALSVGDEVSPPVIDS